MFGERLRSLRRERGLSQQELGAALNISRGAIAGYESAGKEPDYATLCKIADYLDVTVDYLVGNSNERRSGRGDSFVMPEILKTLAELASSNASAAEIMAALPDLNDGQLNRVTGYIQALRSLSGVGGASIMEEKNA